MRRTPLIVLSLIALAAAALLAARPDAPAGAAGRLSVTGSSSVAPLMGEVAKRFEALNLGVRVEVQSGGSSRGLADVRSGLADIGMVSRALGPAEADLAGHLVARDGVALIVHKTNPVAELTPQAVRDLYTGAVASWAAVGGAEMPVTVVHKAEGRSTLLVFLDHFELDNRTITPSVVIGDNEQAIKTVAANPTAVGYVSIGAAEVAIAEGAPIRLLPLGGVEASVAALAAGRFPLARELNLVTTGAPEGLAGRFVAFATSAAVDDLIEAQALVAPQR